MRLLLDQGLPRSSAQLLQALGLDAIHAGECGLARTCDAAILEFARKEDRVVVTLDADFHAMLALSGASRPSVVRIRIQGLRAKGLTDVLKKILDSCEKELAQGAAISVSADQIRVRHLPIRREGVQ